MADDSLNSENWSCTEDYKEFEADSVQNYWWEETGAFNSQHPLSRRWDEESKKGMESVAVAAEKSKCCDADLSDMVAGSPDYSSMVVQDSLSPELPSCDVVSDEVTSLYEPMPGSDPPFSDKGFWLDPSRKKYVDMLIRLPPCVKELIYSDPESLDSIERSPKYLSSFGHPSKLRFRVDVFMVL